LVVGNDTMWIFSTVFCFALQQFYPQEHVTAIGAAMMA